MSKKERRQLRHIPQTEREIECDSIFHLYKFEFQYTIKIGDVREQRNWHWHCHLPKSKLRNSCYVCARKTSDRQHERTYQFHMILYYCRIVRHPSDNTKARKIMMIFVYIY